MGANIIRARIARRRPRLKKRPGGASQIVCSPRPVRGVGVVRTLEPRQERGGYSLGEQRARDLFLLGEGFHGASSWFAMQRPGQLIVLI